MIPPQHYGYPPLVARASRRRRLAAAAAAGILVAGSVMLTLALDRERTSAPATTTAPTAAP